MGIGEAVRHHDKAAIRLACLCGNDGFEFAAVMDGRHGLLHCERSGRSFEGRQIIIGLNKITTRATPGAICLSSSNHLPAIPGSITMKPVTFPPGCGKLATKPLPSGSETNAKTIGMVRVSCNRAAVVGVL